MGDADIAGIADCRAPTGGEPWGPAWSECSDSRRTESGWQQFHDDVTGAGLPPELAAAARSEET
eukprot:8430079-Alexandrium_andersonii.AAC.1